MKTQLLSLLFVSALIGLTSCSKKTDYCENGILDGDETEIDCGGGCEACPPYATFTATVDGSPYVASNFFDAGQNGSTIYFTTGGTAGTYVGVTFVGTALNTALPITDANITLASQGIFNYQLTDTGSVVLTAIDTERKIISGRVGFSATAGPTTKTVSNGVFENVRYGN